ncbi:Uncharacterised protein [Salmonella enterica]|uniref:Uncharacterized protein n=1 Tax=Salmonella enterica TaxID=28901 RepID=A0A379Q300_SALER|nr:Uncharacterised protein [Salmonella enterica subsp. salamae]SQI68305.1 Uncharacterised protein [Salmonella enterica subsp. salamae]SUF36828.1 Uncharacterised protein [Salmonella enterica]
MVVTKNISPTPFALSPYIMGNHSQQHLAIFMPEANSGLSQILSMLG